MRYVYFTKTLQKLDLKGLIAFCKETGIEGFDLAVEQSIYRVAEVYGERGIDFPGVFRRFDGSWREGQVLVCPPGRRSTEGLH